MKEVSPSKVLVFIDIPDPDNILLALDVVKSHPKEHVSIVLSARIADLSVPRYGNDFPLINKSVSLENMALPIETDEPQNVPEDLRRWFYKDADLTQPEVVLDTILYMRASALRIAQIFQSYGVCPTRYDIFWDRPSPKHMPRPDMRHAFHVHDFKFNFNDEEMLIYERAIAECRERGNNLRTRLRGVIYRYIERQIGELALEAEVHELQNLQSLINANRSTNSVKIFIGGPFTEALQYLEGTHPSLPNKVFAMAASIKQDRNLFKNTQFNIWKDMNSAKKFFDLVQTNGIKLRLIPTECVKGTKINPCPYVLKLSEYKDILGGGSLLYSMIEQYKRDTDRGDTYSAFDWVTGIAGTKPKLFTWKSIVLETACDGEEENVCVERVKQSSILMAWDDYSVMERNRNELMNRMRKTVEMAPGVRVKPVQSNI